MPTAQYIQVTDLDSIPVAVFSPATPWVPSHACATRVDQAKQVYVILMAIAFLGASEFNTSSRYA